MEQREGRLNLSIGKGVSLGDWRALRSAKRAGKIGEGGCWHCFSSAL